MSELKPTKDLINTGDKFDEISDVLLDTLLEYPEIQKVDLAVVKLINRRLSEMRSG